MENGQGMHNMAADQFSHFLKSIKISRNSSLVEAVLKGYAICCEAENGENDLLNPNDMADMTLDELTSLGNGNMRGTRVQYGSDNLYIYLADMITSAAEAVQENNLLATAYTEVNNNMRAFDVSVGRGNNEFKFRVVGKFKSGNLVFFVNGAGYTDRHAATDAIAECIANAHPDMAN